MILAKFPQRLSLFIVTVMYLVLPVSQINAATVNKNNTSPIRIAVSANFSHTLKRTLTEFTASTGIETQIISGSTGSLFQQIVHGAPYDIFLAADKIRPSKLVEMDLALEESQATYAVGTIAIWSGQWTNDEQLPTFSSLTKQLLKNDIRLAVANPDLAPYGMAAKQALESSKLWQHLKNRLVTGINIGQTFQQTRSQAVNYGIVATSQLVQHQQKGVEIPLSHYSPIAQQMVVLKNSKQVKQAKMLAEFLLLPSAQREFVEQGYSPIPKAIETAAKTALVKS